MELPGVNDISIPYLMEELQEGESLVGSFEIYYNEDGQMMLNLQVYKGSQLENSGDSEDEPVPFIAVLTDVPAHVLNMARMLG